MDFEFRFYIFYGLQRSSSLYYIICFWPDEGLIGAETCSDSDKQIKKQRILVVFWLSIFNPNYIFQTQRGWTTSRFITCLITQWLINGYCTIDRMAHVMLRGVNIVTVLTRRDVGRIVTLCLNSESFSSLSLQLSCFSGRSGNYSRILTFKQKWKPSNISLSNLKHSDMFAHKIQSPNITRSLVESRIQNYLIFDIWYRYIC
jgi:hypothetical protein